MTVKEFEWPAVFEIIREYWINEDGLEVPKKYGVKQAFSTYLPNFQLGASKGSPLIPWVSQHHMAMGGCRLLKPKFALPGNNEYPSVCVIRGS